MFYFNDDDSVEELDKNSCAFIGSMILIFIFLIITTLTNCEREPFLFAIEFY